MSRNVTIFLCVMVAAAAVFFSFAPPETVKMVINNANDQAIGGMFIGVIILVIFLFA